MERLELQKKFERLQKAHKKFCESLEKLKKNQHHEDYDTYRDSAIQRFEFTADPLWKFLRVYMTWIGVTLEEPGPKATYRQAKTIGLIKETELPFFIDMVEDRNETSHAYDETEAEDISKDLPHYCIIIGDLLERIKISENNL